LQEITRDDIMSANSETEKVTGIPFMTEARNEQALNILNS